MGTKSIDIDQIERRLDDLWEIGKTGNGGVTRLAYSDEETEAIEYILGELPDAYAVRTDSIGNVFATRHPDADQTVMVGSHLDTVFNGGRLDGTLGVVAALEAIETVDRAEDTTGPPLTLAIFRGEESARFGQHTIGSRGALGLLTVEDFATTDQSNIPLWQAMQQAGLQPDYLDEPTVDLDRVQGFFEVHIEQGRVLDEANTNVGIVTSIRAPARHRVTVVGEYDHSGATPMGLREDALAAAAEMITRVEGTCDQYASEGDGVGTVGDITAVEGAINKVCGEVTFPIDLRSNDEQYRDNVEEAVLTELESVTQNRDVTVEIDTLDRSTPVRLDESQIDALAEAASAVDTSYQRLPSGGGHDAMNFQQVSVPTGMLFTPSVDGISHNPAEATPSDAIEAATETLAHALSSVSPDDETQGPQSQSTENTV